MDQLHSRYPVAHRHVACQAPRELHSGGTVTQDRDCGHAVSPSLLISTRLHPRRASPIAGGCAAFECAATVGRYIRDGLLLMRLHIDGMEWWCNRCGEEGACSVPRPDKARQRVLALC